MIILNLYEAFLFFKINKWVEVLNLLVIYRVTLHGNNGDVLI